MQELNLQIQEAIENDDIEAFLSIYTDAGITHKSAELRYFFNESIYQYGYGCLVTYNEHKDSVQIFEENGKVGLKSNEGEVLLPPAYDEIFGFGENEQYSVVRNGDKYGHIDINGKVVVPLIYDDAFDFIKDSRWDQKTETLIEKYRAVVQLEGKYGVIDETHTIVLPLIYEDINLREQHNSFPFMIFVTIEGKKAILDIEGKELYPSIITTIHHPNDEDDDSGFINFYERLLVKTEDETYYLNPSFEPYGYNVEIIQNGLELRTKRNTVTYCFIARNKEGKMGIINWHNEILLPFEFDTIEEYTSTGANILYKTLNEGKPSLYQITNKSTTTILIPPVYDAICGLFSAGADWRYVVVEKNGKKGVYYLQGKKEVLPPQFEAISFFSYNEQYLCAFLKDKIIQYKVPSIEEVPLDLKFLEMSIKYAEEPDKAKAILKKLKPVYIKEVLELIFSDPKDIAIAQKRYSKVNFLQPESILDAANTLNMTLEKAGSPIDDMQTLYTAFQYHFDNKNSDAREIKWGMMNFFLARMHYEKENYPLAIEYAKRANMFIYVNNILYIDVLQFICYTYYDSDKNEEAVEAGLSGLEAVNQQRKQLKSGSAWVSNIKKERDMLDNYEETFNYYVGCAYFYQNNRDYQKALEYIEKSITNKNDWNIYIKSFIRVASIYKTVENTMDVFPILEEVEELGKQYNANDDHCYIKYLLAFSYYHNLNDPQKALDKIEESLAINPHYENSLELKVQIEENEKGKGKGKGFFGFFKR